MWILRYNELQDSSAVLPERRQGTNRIHNTNFSKDMSLFNSKKRFFSSKIQQVERAIWDLEFKLFKVREMREERRKQRDRSVEALDNLEGRLKVADIPEDVKTALTKQR